MVTLTQPLRDEHKELLPHIELLRTTLRCVLYGLSAVVKVHFAKEEEIYLPLLDARLTAEEATRLFETMERAAQEAKSTVG